MLRFTKKIRSIRRPSYKLKFVYFQWVDEVVEGAPYVTTLETLDK
jgi:glycerol-3-phosphate cytidylyltransferase-like family protein